jgi:hypothetical protein
MLTLLQALVHVSIIYVLLVIGGTVPVLQPPAHDHLEYDKFIVLSNDSLKFNFLIATFRFSKSEFRMKCEAISAISEQAACRGKAARLDKLKQQLVQLRTALQRTTLPIQVVVTIEGFASIDQDVADYDNVGLSNDRARSVYDGLMDGDMVAPPALKNFVIKPERKGIFLPKAWWRAIDDGIPRLVDISEDTWHSWKDQLTPRGSTCAEGIGLELPSELQQVLFQKLKRQNRSEFDKELESGRKVEVWVRTDSTYIRNYVNPAHKTPDCIMEPKEVL